MMAGAKQQAVEVADAIGVILETFLDGAPDDFPLAGADVVERDLNALAITTADGSRFVVTVEARP